MAGKKPSKYPPNPEPPKVSSFCTGKEAAGVYLTNLDKTCRKAPAAKGIELDIFPVSRLEPGSFTIICSRPAQGKTAYLANIASALARMGHCAAIFLPDMAVNEFVCKMMSILSGTEYIRVKRGFLSKEELMKVTRAAELLSKSNIYFSTLTGPDSVSYDPLDVEAALLADALKKTGRKLDVILIDSLNHLNLESHDYRMLSHMAKELMVTVLGSFGLASDDAKGFAMSLPALREAGIDEAYVDQILAVCRPGFYDQKIRRITPERVFITRTHNASGVTDGKNWELYFDDSSLTFTTKPAVKEDCADAV